MSLHVYFQLSSYTPANPHRINLSAPATRLFQQFYTLGSYPHTIPIFFPAAYQNHFYYSLSWIVLYFSNSLSAKAFVSAVTFPFPCKIVSSLIWISYRSFSYWKRSSCSFRNRYSLNACFSLPNLASVSPAAKRTLSLSDTLLYIHKQQKTTLRIFPMLFIYNYSIYYIHIFTHQLCLLYLYSHPFSLYVLYTHLNSIPHFSSNWYNLKKEAIVLWACENAHG